MADPIVAADALPAVSSPAAESTPVDAADTLDRLSETELLDWRMTGALPSASPVTTPIAASSAAPPVQDPAVSTETPPQPAGSDPAANTHLDAAGRIPQLLKDRKDAADRAERAERRLADLEARHRQPPVDARPAASSAAPAGLVEPNPETFPYGTADPGYVKAVAKYEAAQFMAAERATWEEGQRQTRAREESTRVITAFEAKAAESRAKHPDFDAVALLAPTTIPQGSAIDLFVLEAPAGAELLYHLQQPANAGELTRILRLGPLEQLTALVRLGDRLTGPPPAATSTSAPPPPPTLSTRATPADPVARALADDDFGAYREAMNKRDLAKLKD